MELLLDDATGAPYWFDVATGATRWAEAHELPHNWMQHVTLPGEPSVVDGLAGWEEAFTEAGDFYFFNRITGESRWELPVEAVPPAVAEPVVTSKPVPQMRPRSHAIVEQRGGRRSRRQPRADWGALPEASRLLLPMGTDADSDAGSGVGDVAGALEPTPWGLTQQQSLEERSSRWILASKARRARRQRRDFPNGQGDLDDLEGGMGNSTSSSSSGTDSDLEAALAASNTPPLARRALSSVRGFASSAGRVAGTVIAAIVTTVSSLATKATPYVDHFITKAATTTSTAISVYDKGVKLPVLPPAAAADPAPPTPPSTAPAAPGVPPSGSPPPSSSTLEAKAEVKLSVPRRVPVPPSEPPPTNRPPPAGDAPAAGKRGRDAVSISECSTATGDGEVAGEETQPPAVTV